jgi:hypothetical protein
VVQVVRGGEHVNRGEDPELLGRYTPGQLSGAIVWSEYDGYMGTAYPTHVMLNPAAPGAIEFKRWVPDADQWAAAHNRYFLEDRPAFLDSPGEFWFERKGAGGRLYVRLPADQGPGTARIEAASRLCIIDATRLRHVRIRDLTFRFTNLQWDITDPSETSPDVEPAAIRLEGSGCDIDVDHCRFDNVATAVLLRAAPDDRRRPHHRQRCPRHGPRRLPHHRRRALDEGRSALWPSRARRDPEEPGPSHRLPPAPGVAWACDRRRVRRHDGGRGKHPG